MSTLYNRILFTQYFYVTDFISMLYHAILEYMYLIQHVRYLLGEMNHEWLESFIRIFHIQGPDFYDSLQNIYYARKCPLCVYILGVMPNTTA